MNEYFFELASSLTERTKWKLSTAADQEPLQLYIVLGDYIVSLGMQYYLEELFHKYKVDLAFWGHYHSYERTCAVYKRECQEEGLGTTHIVVGSAGYSLDTEGYYNVKWSRYHENNYGYGRVLVANKSALYYEWVRNKDDVVRDKVWLIKAKEIEV